MRITRAKLRRLLAEQYRVLNEAAAKNWQEYIAAGKTPDSKAQRAQIKSKWESLGGNKKLYPPSEVKLKANPGNFSNTYKGWTQWYFACIKDPAAMKLINRDASYPGGKNKGHIDTNEMLAIQASLIPLERLKMAADQIKDTANKKIVDDLIADLNFSGAGMSSSEIASFGKTSAQNALEIIMNLELDLKSGETDLAATDLSKYTSGDDHQEPEAKVKVQTDPDARASTDIPVVGPDPDKDRSIKVKPPKSRKSKRIFNKRIKNESAELTRNKIRRLIRESILKEHPNELSTDETKYQVNVPPGVVFQVLNDTGWEDTSNLTKSLNCIISTKEPIDDRKFSKINSDGDLLYKKTFSDGTEYEFMIYKANFKIIKPAGTTTAVAKKPAIAKSWEAYVKSPLTGGEAKGVKVRDGWAAVCEADPSFGDGSYKAWKSWYMKSIKDSALMATAGKKVGQQLSPEAVVKLYVGLIMITPALAKSFNPSEITGLSIGASYTQKDADTTADIFNTALKKAPPAEKKKIKEKIAIFRNNIKAKFPKINFKSGESEGETSQAAKKKMTVAEAQRTADNYVAGQTSPALFAVGVGRDKSDATFKARQNFMNKQGKSQMTLTNTRAVKTYTAGDGTVVVVLEVGEENLKESQERLSRGALYRRRYYGRY